jgi:hypothetical protein
MMKRILALAAMAAMTPMALMVTLAAPAMAGEAKGEVQEIIIKIQTADGPRWYSLGSDLSKIDIRKGAVVRYNYEEDTIDAIEVDEVAPGDPPAAAQ